MPTTARAGATSASTPRSWRSADGAPGTLVLPDGRRVALGEDRAVIGRLPDCAVAAHRSAGVAPSRRDPARRVRLRVVDLGSTNGMQVNGVRVREQLLNDGDVILVGAT